MAGDNFQEREKERQKIVSGESTNENGSRRKKGVISPLPYAAWAK